MVDILLSTYNGGKYLKDFLNSLLDQTYRNWKLIVRDDGSIDDTVEILKNFAKSNPERVEIIIDNSRSLGPQKSFLSLLKFSKAEYIMFADQDDIWLPNKIEVTLKKMREVESKLGEEKPVLIHTDLKVVDENLNIIADSFWKYQNNNPELKNLNNLVVQNNVVGCTIMINKALKALIDLIPDKAIMHDWWVALVVSAFGVIDYVPEATILYRQHGGQNTGAKKYSFYNFYDRFIRKPSKAYNAVRMTIEQAGEFLRLYRNRLLDWQREMLSFYVDIDKKSRFDRLKGLIKYRLFKQGILRNLGFIVVVISL
jgi:glycosyltransferase involved in cell wall biosynthesis